MRCVDCVAAGRIRPPTPIEEYEQGRRSVCKREVSHSRRSPEAERGSWGESEPLCSMFCRVSPQNISEIAVVKMLFCLCEGLKPYTMLKIAV